MKTFTCGAARRRLTAFHDGELTTSEQIAVAAHLDVCSACAECVAESDLVGAALRLMTPGRRTLNRDEAIGFHASVVNRVKAERDASFVARVREMFDDMHLVYAGRRRRGDDGVRRHHARDDAVREQRASGFAGRDGGVPRDARLERERGGD